VPYLVTQYPSFSSISKCVSNYVSSFAESEQIIASGPPDSYLPVGYVINMTHRKDRWNHIKITFDSIKSMRINRVEGTRANPGLFGCFLSHQKIVRMAKQKKLPYVIVIEDDCKILNPAEFDTRFPKIIKWLDEHLNEWKYFNIAPTYSKAEDHITAILDRDIPLVQLTFGYSAHFVIYNAAIYDFMLKQRPGKPFDLLLSEAFPQITSIPYMAHQIESFSDIQGHVIKYDNLYTYAENSITEYMKTH
jgi:hypothetical protein